MLSLALYQALASLIHFDTGGDALRLTTVEIYGRPHVALIDTGAVVSVSRDTFIPNRHKVTLLGHPVEVELTASQGFMKDLPYDLIIGRDVLSQFLLVHRPGKAMELLPRTETALMPVDAVTVPLGKSVWGPTIPVTLDGVTVPLVFDTGAGRVELNKRDAARLTQVWKGQKPEVSSAMGISPDWTEFVRHPISLYTAKRVEIAGHLVGLDWSVGVERRRDKEFVSLIGWDFLKTNTWTLDLTGGRLWFDVPGRAGSGSDRKL